MNKDIEQKQIIQNRLHELYLKRVEILSLSPEDALNRILEQRQPFPLVHSFPEYDFYFLIHDIGLDDSLELLSMASGRQWEYILDAEIWQKDRIDLSAATQWMNLLMKSDPDRMVRWSVEEKKDLIEYYLFNNIDLIIREHDQDPSDFDDDYFTDDEFFYVRLKDINLDPETDKITKEQRDEFLREFLTRLSAYDHIMYQNILLESSSLIPAEMEEESLRLRNVRIAEKGFIPFDEAVGIYQPVKPDFFQNHVKKNTIRKPDDINIPVPLYASQILDKDNLFSHALEKIDSYEVLQNLQTEFALLCNQIIAADHQIIRQKDQLKKIVKKACSYLSMGLDILGNKEPGQHIYLIKKFQLLHIFKLGYGQGLQLKWDAESWRRQSWFESKKLSLGFWDEEWLGVLGGLLIKKPLFFDNYKTGVLYREFYSLNDIKESRDVLEKIQAVDWLFSFMNIEFINISGLITWKNSILSLWARNYLNLHEVVEPVNLDIFKKFYKDLWKEDLYGRKIHADMKSLFIKWLSNKTGLEIYEISEKTGHIFEELFNEIEQEYSSVSEQNLDPKYITLFLLC
ncbi:Uncharacterized protein dnl_60730 [Desulfonema limicola]|uniref:Uncharacterized protein n=2 Tax=Desulfonema limicola TaxID=45656 RepID=A0A975BE81_9BACT|nr:Uncharacterized protein dnl_60730 [Desulfonema limicola]